MPDSEAIINPIMGKSSPNPGSSAVLVATRGDLSSLCRLLNLEKDNYQDLFMSRLYIHDKAKPVCALVGPLIGAPYAAMLLETLIARGVEKFIFFGWCGSISPSLTTGDIMVPTSAHIDEGTSRNYHVRDNGAIGPDLNQLSELKQTLRHSDLPYQTGAIWSTDAIYRETVEKVKLFRKQNAVAVDMETSALFSVARFRRVAITAIHAVSDELWDFRWRPGFSSPKFKKTREAVCSMLHDFCRKIQ